MALAEINWNPPRSQLRNFGLVCLVAFGALGAWIFFRQSIFGFGLSAGTARVTAYVLWAVGAIAGLLALVSPALVKPLFLGLTLLTFPIGYVLSHVIMAVIFYGVFTPVGLVFKLMGRDPMQRQLLPDAKTYWSPRAQVKDPKRYLRQF